MDSIKFGLYSVTCGDKKARVHYSINNRIDGRECVTVYAKCYGSSLQFFDEVANYTDSMTDYFEGDRVVLFKGSEHYAAALVAAERCVVKDRALSDARRAKCIAKRAATA